MPKSQPDELSNDENLDPVVATSSSTAAVPPADPVALTAEAQAVGEAATEALAADVAPPDVATTIAPGYRDAMAKILPNAGTITGEPTPELPITQGFFSHTVDGLVNFVEALLPAPLAKLVDNAQHLDSVAKLGDDIERLAAQETIEARAFLERAKAIALGHTTDLWTDAEVAVRDIALSAIPSSLRGPVGAFIGLVLGRPGETPALEKNALVGIQHGLYALSGRLTHIFGR